MMTGSPEAHFGISHHCRLQDEELTLLCDVLQ